MDICTWRPGPSEARGLGSGQSGCWGLNLGLLQERHLSSSAPFLLMYSLCLSTCSKSPWGCSRSPSSSPFPSPSPPPPLSMLGAILSSPLKCLLPQTLRSFCTLTQDLLSAAMLLLWCPRRSFSYRSLPGFLVNLPVVCTHPFPLANLGCLCSLSETSSFPVLPIMLPEALSLLSWVTGLAGQQFSNFFVHSYLPQPHSGPLWLVGTHPILHQYLYFTLLISSDATTLVEMNCSGIIKFSNFVLNTVQVLCEL